MSLDKTTIINAKKQIKAKENKNQKFVELL